MTTQTGTEFDYETAWREAAKPLFESLAPEVRALFADVCEVAKDLAQNAACDMIWPDDGGALRARFEALSDATLATAARATYFYGHWSPEGTAAKTAGGTRKFASYADQVLRARFGLSREARGRGAHILVHEGVLRVAVEAPDSWTLDEVAYATSENVQRIREVVAQIRMPATSGRLTGADRKAWSAYADAVKREAVEARVHLAPAGDGPEVRILDVQRYMTPERTLARRSEARRAARKDAAADLDKVALAVATIRAAAAAQNAVGDRTDVEHELKLLFISTGTSEAFNARARERADQIVADDAEALAAGRKLFAQRVAINADLPWDGCKVAFSVESEVTDQLSDIRAWPFGWTLDSVEASGASGWVAVFSVEGVLTRGDGEAVRNLLDGLASDETRRR